MITEVNKDFNFHEKGKYLVSNKIFLDLVFNNECNYKCKFCIARTKTYSENDYENWKKSLKRTFEIFGEDIDSIIILGGESTIDIHFFDKLEYLDEVTKDKHVFTILTTNGYMLKHEAFLEKVAASSIDTAVETVIPTIGLTKDELKHIYDVIHASGKTLRFNTNVARNNLSTVEEMEEYIKYFKGCYDAIKFTPLMKTDMFGTTDDVLEYTHKYAMEKEEIKELFDSLANRHTKKSHNSKVFGLINYGDLTVFGEHIILKYEQVEDMYDLDRVIPTLKMYPNGNLSNEWDYAKNILDDFD